MLFFDLFLLSALHLAGYNIFGVFEERTPRWRKLLKQAVFLILTAAISLAFGHPWSLLWIIGIFSLAIVGHVWWALSHGINPVTAEPRDKYYALRGWN